MLSWAVTQKIVTFPDGNPAIGHRFHRELPRERILSVAEIRTFVTDIGKAPMDVMSKRALLLELLLAQRSGEIAAMRKADINLAAATWTIVDNKSSRPHVVPLPPWARSIIEKAVAQAKGSWLFASPVGDPRAKDARPIDSHALGKALGRAQRRHSHHGRPLPKKKTDTWVFDFRNRAGEPAPITPHDLRRTCSSYLELLGHGDVIRGAILNHSRGRNVTAKHYSAAELLKLKRSALLQWEVALRSIMAGQDPFSSAAEDDRAEEVRLIGDGKDMQAPPAPVP
jgi:integrase